MVSLQSDLQDAEGKSAAVQADRRFWSILRDMPHVGVLCRVQQPTILAESQQKTPTFYLLLLLELVSLFTDNTSGLFGQLRALM